jgi:hypothetical protein
MHFLCSSHQNEQPAMMKKSSMGSLLTVAVQMARVAAFETSKQRAIASLIVSEEDDDKKKRLQHVGAPTF